MNGFISITSLPAPLPEADIDTDIIFPARFLLLLNKNGLGKQLFHERRNVKGKPKFILDTPPFDTAQILVTGPNFGVGSSREQAVWALADFGIKCVIAPSFGEIFAANCVRNGVLPIVLAEAEHDRVMRAAVDASPLTVDLKALTITLSHSDALRFDFDPFGRRMLLLGLDEIDMIVKNDRPEIDAFETQQRGSAPWLDLADYQDLSFSDPNKPDAPHDR